MTTIDVTATIEASEGPEAQEGQDMGATTGKCGFTITAYKTDHKLWVWADASGKGCPLRDFIATYALIGEVEACGRACLAAYRRTGDRRYAAAHRACQRRWLALRAG